MHFSRCPICPEELIENGRDLEGPEPSLAAHNLRQSEKKKRDPKSRRTRFREFDSEHNCDVCNYQVDEPKHEILRKIERRNKCFSIRFT